MRPLQRDIDYLALGLWKARVWMNEQRRKGVREAPAVPPVIARKRKAA